MAVQYVVNNIPGEIDFSAGGTRIGRVVQNVKNLLLTRMGEIPYDRQRGLNPAVFDLPYDEAEALIVQELDRVMLWEPDAEVSDAEATLLPSGQVYIKAILEIGIDE